MSRAAVRTAFLSCLLLFPAVGLRAGLSVDEVLANMEKGQAGLKAISAELQERLTLRGSLQSQDIRGHVILEKPNKIHVQFDKPTPQLFVCDGSVVWLYTPALNQVLRQKTAGSDLLKQFELQLGQEIKNLKEQFTITKLREETLDGKTAHVLKLVPRSARKNSRNYYEARIWVAEPSWFPVKSAGYMANGSQLTLKLSRIVVNPAIPAGQFTFKPPSGVEVIDVSQLLGSMKEEKYGK
jgi:outer membrane lipoprotein carrier protein